jgi:hypothetical protein
VATVEGASRSGSIRATSLASPGAPPSSGVELLKYPYPYRSALAVSNDIDGTVQRTFLDWHRFVCGTGETPYGPGLGLEVADSFWVWSDTEEFSLYHNSPAFGRKTKSAEYEMIVDLHRQGWIDAMHGFGTWINPYTLTRPEIEDALAELDGIGVKPRIFVNHGGGLHMSCSVGGVWGYYQYADAPDHVSYSMDLLRKAGFKYFWTDVFFESQKFGEYAVYRDDERAELHKRYNSRRFLRLRDLDPAASEAIVLPALGVATKAEAVEMLSNSVLVPNRMRDGTNVINFKRFRGEYPPDTGSLGIQISDARLDELVEREAAVIVYQHIAVWRGLSSPRRDWRAWVNYRCPVLDEHALWAWRALAERQQRGEILVATTSRLLDYLWMRENIVYFIAEEGGRRVIALEAIDCPVYGRHPVTSEAVQGLSFVCKGNVDAVVVRAADQAPIATQRTYLAAEDRTIVMVPWQRLKWPI